MSDAPSASIPALGALRLVAVTADAYAALVGTWQAVLGREPDAAFGSRQALHESSTWRLADGRHLIIARETEPSRETFIEGATAWLLFYADDVDALHAAAQTRGADLLNDPIATAFATRGFFANDPTGAAIYVGQPWKPTEP